MIRTEGIASVRVQKVASAVGVSKASVFLDFESRAALIAESVCHELLNETVRRWEATAVEVEATTGLLEALPLIRQISNECRSVDGQFRHWSLLDVAVWSRTSTECLPALREALQALLEPIIQILRHLRSQDLLAPDVDVASAALLVIGSGMSVCFDISGTEGSQGANVLSDISGRTLLALLDPSVVPLTPVAPSAAVIWPADQQTPEQPQQQSAKREQIGDAAVGVLDEVGPSALTVRQVADRAGVSPALIYRSFEDREALVSHAAVTLLERALDEARSGMNDAALPFLGRDDLSMGSAADLVIEILLSTPAELRWRWATAVSIARTNAGVREVLLSEARRLRESLRVVAPSLEAVDPQVLNDLRRTLTFALLLRDVLGSEDGIEQWTETARAMLHSAVVL
jgi:AcrR family transcriptional regulator